jgi:hypothetical protein
MSLVHHAGDGDNKPVTRKSAKETVKTTAQETPGVSVTCGDYRVLSTNAHGLRVHRAPGVSCAFS